MTEPAHILVIEDNPEDRSLLQYLLTRVGYLQTSTGSVHEAMRLAAARPPDLIILDMRLPRESGGAPDPVAGADLASRLKESAHTRAVPVIGLSAYGPPESLKRSLDHYFDKPPSLAELLGTIEAAIPPEKVPPSPFA